MRDPKAMQWEKTLKEIPEDIRDKIEQQVFQTLEKKVPEAFPGQKLNVVNENGIIRIYGDLSLDLKAERLKG